METGTQDPVRRQSPPGGARGANDAPAAPDLAALSPDALVLLSPDGAVLAVNATAERMFGYRRDEVVGMHAIGLVHPDDLWEAADSLRTTQRVEGVYGSPSLLRLRRADGGYFTAEVQGANYAEDPSVRGVVISIRDVSERREVAEALANTEETFHAVVKHASEIILLLDADGRVQYSSQALTAMTGWRPEELLGNTTEHFVHPDDQPDLFAVTVPAFDVPGAQVTAEFRLLHRSGEVRHCDLLLVNLLDQPAVGRVALYVRDVTERKAAEEARAEVEERFVSAFQNAPIGMALQDLEGRFLLVNRALCNLVGYSAEYLLSATGDALTHPDDLPDQAALRQRVVSGEIAGYHFEKRFVRADGRVVWVKLSVSTVVGADGQPAYVVAHVEDISGARRDQERLTHQALHDILTGLPNRALLIDRMGHALDRAKRGAPPFAVLFCDLDRFKVVNDSLGHEVGDRLLVQCAERLQGVVRAGDTVARFGGDEFVVLCEDVHDKEEVHGVAERIGAALRSPFVLDDAEFVVSTSIGIAFSGEHTLVPADALRDADAAMYRAKEQGRSRWVVFAPEMRSVVVHREETERALRSAIDKGELRLHYQPIVRLGYDEIVGAEALLRWEMPERGLVPPGEFVPLAEETGLIVPVGAWVMGEATRRLAEWRDAGVLCPGFVMTVNLSLRQLDDPRLVENVAAVLEASGIEASSLCLELTESALAADGESAVRVLRDLRTLGVGLAIDDFGTGYSALSHLKRFPFDTLKIDRSFIDGLGRDPEDEAIVAAVVGVARALDLKVIAEGIETDGQLSALRAQGVRTGQGFLLGRPAPAADLLARLRR